MQEFFCASTNYIYSQSLWCFYVGYVDCEVSKEDQRNSGLQIEGNTVEKMQQLSHIWVECWYDHYFYSHVACSKWLSTFAIPTHNNQ